MSASVWSPGSTITIDSASLLALFQIRGGWCGTAGGTADAIVLTPSSVLAAYAAGQQFSWISNGPNTGAVTVAISGLAPVALVKEDVVALAAEDIPGVSVITATYDGTRLVLMEVASVNKSLFTTAGDTVVSTAAGVPARLPATASVAAHATTMNPWVARNVVLTGAIVTFTDIADAPYIGAVVWIKVNDAHVWTNGAIFRMPGLANYTCAADDWLRIEAITLSTFSVIVFKADGTAVSNVDTDNGKNSIIGGDFSTNPWQRGISFAAIATATFFADRFAYYKVGAMVHTVTKASDAPTASQAGVTASHCAMLDCTTVDSAIAAGDFCMVSTKILGYDWLSISQQNITLSFWHKHTKTGVYCGFLRNSGSDRSYVFEYNQTLTDTWEKTTVVISASPSAGTWNYTTGVGIELGFVVSCGTTFHTLTPATWVSANAMATASQVNACDDVANNFRLGLIQLEPGSTATRFHTESATIVLANCQRFYERSTLSAPAATDPTLSWGESMQAWATIAPGRFPGGRYKIPKNSVPTVTIYNTAGVAGSLGEVPSGGNIAGTVVDSTDSGFAISANCTAGQRFIWGWTASAEI